MSSKFLNLCEQLSPENSSDPKWELIDFLKSKGINVSIVRDTDMLYVDTGTKTIAITISQNEEDESIQAGYGNYKVDSEVEKLANTASSGLKGQAAKLFGTSAQTAKSAVKDRSNVAKQAVGVYKQDTDSLKKSLQNYKRSSSQITQP
jgi:hypothetical protein